VFQDVHHGGIAERLDKLPAKAYNAGMEKKDFINFRIRKDTRDTLKIVAALSRESMLETLDRLVRAEYERLQQEGGQRHAADKKDQA
jgi:hypothetical protein